MNKSLKILLIAIIFIIMIYLIISAIYIVLHIDFGNPENNMLALTEGFNPKKNVVRTIMGLPKTYSMDTSVPPIYLIQAGIKILFVILLMFVNIRIIKKMTIKDENENKKVKEESKIK